MNKAKKEYPKSAEEFLDKYVDKYFSSSVIMHEDELAIIIRAHLLVEVLIEMFIKKKLNSDEILQERDFTFHMKTVLARSLGFGIENILEAIQQLNKIRNSFAHNIKTKLKDQKTDKILHFIADNDELEKFKSDKKVYFSLGVHSLIGFLTAAVFKK